MKKVIRDLEVIENKPVGGNNFILLLKSTENLPPMRPGQFCQVKVDKAPEVYLRRPFSIHSVDYKAKTLTLLIKAIGKGTTVLSGITQGERLNIVYPLGNGFSLTMEPNVLLVGGGCGVAPLLFLAQTLKEMGIIPTILVGGKTTEDIPRLEAYRKIAETHVATEDGSLGEKGLVTQHTVFKTRLAEFKRVYTCGPEAMMKAVAQAAEALEIPCEVSLENTMACGIGACLCCVTETKEGHKCVCTDGPVFDSRNLNGWNIDKASACSLPYIKTE
ncbi:MAG: dihydroorotate dehydrogenase electron transfer subunit [Bacteroidota bacterium]|nr:dihydroorotate dehydrogenase electron transfer subunit [Bacteroidota bacterium]